MHRRSLLWLLAAAPMAACGPKPSVAAADPSASAPPSAAASTSVAPRARPAVAADYAWFAGNRDLAKGFTFIWVKDLSSRDVMDRLGAKELERVYWHQLVGPGDGQRGYPNRSYFGVGRIDDWVLVVEDNGRLGADAKPIRELSEGTTVISHHRAQNGRGRLLAFTDGVLDLDFDPLTAPPRRGARTAELASMIAAAGFGASKDPAQGTAAAFALTERLTDIPMTQELLESKTYLLSMVTVGGQ